MKKILLLSITSLTMLMADFTLEGDILTPVSGTTSTVIDSITDIASNEVTYDKEVTVNSILQLEQAVENADIPTRIIVQDGTYNNQDITLRGNSAKVHIIAANRGKAIFQRLMVIYGNNITIEGFLFNGGSTSQDIGGELINRGNDNRVTRCIWDDSKSNTWCRSLAGYRFEIDHCLFQNKTNNSSIDQGPVVAVYSYMEDTIPREHKIHHNYFFNIIKGRDSNGYESIIVYSANSETDPRESFIGYGLDHNIVVSYNLFEKANGEGEIISGKTNGVTYENNTFRNSAGGLTLRYGKNCIVRKNFFSGENIAYSYGIMVHDVNQNIYGNYISVANNISAIKVRDGGSIQGPALNFNIHDNYIKGGKYNIRFGQDLTGWYTSASGILKNNTFVQGNATQVLSLGKVDKSKVIFEGNQYYGSLGDSSNGFTKLGNIPTAPSTSKALTSNDVGPNAL